MDWNWVQLLNYPSVLSKFEQGMPMYIFQHNHNSKLLLSMPIYTVKKQFKQVESF